MAPPKQNNDELHWFWRLTTKWWFLPAFYIFLALLVPLFVNEGTSADVWSAYFISIMIMPVGILWFFSFLINEKILYDYIQIPFLIISHIFQISSIILIQLYKSKFNKVLKWLIILLLFLIILSFIGCVIGDY